MWEWVSKCILGVPRGRGGLNLLSIPMQMNEKIIENGSVYDFRKHLFSRHFLPKGLVRGARMLRKRGKHWFWI